MGRHYADLCRAHGVEPASSVESLLHERAALNLAPTSPAIEPLLAAVPRTRYVGPLLFSPLELAPTPAPASPEAAKRVLVYLGVGTFSEADLLPELAQAFPAPEYTVTVATRYGNPCTTGNITMAREMGMTRALQETDLLVARGGQNGLMAALLAGVPVIGVPGEHVEPRFNLSVLEVHGAARIIDSPRAGALKEAAQHLFTTGAAHRARLLGRFTDCTDPIQALQDSARRSHQ